MYNLNQRIYRWVDSNITTPGLCWEPEGGWNSWGNWADADIAYNPV